MQFEEETLESRVLYRGRILTLREDRVRLPGGKEGRREIVEHPGAVAVVPLLPGGKLRLVRQYRKAVEEVTLEIPAGKLEPGEDPLACAVRELEEETGLKAQNLTPLARFFSTPGFSNEMMHLFLAEELNPGNLAPDEDEILEQVTVLLPEALEMIARGEIRDAKTIAGILLASRRE